MFNHSTLLHNIQLIPADRHAAHHFASDLHKAEVATREATRGVRTRSIGGKEGQKKTQGIWSLSPISSGSEEETVCIIASVQLLSVLAWVPPGVLLYTLQRESLSCRMDEKRGTLGRASGRIFPRRKRPNNCIHIMPARAAKYTEEGKMCRIRIVWKRDVSLGEESHRREGKQPLEEFIQKL